MLAGFSGHLVSEAFLEDHLAKSISDGAGSRAPGVEDHARWALGEWRRQRDLLGPASSFRAMLYTGAVPLVAALGLDPPSSVDLADHAAALVATLRSPSGPLALVVTAWGERLDPLWRLAVTQAAARAARWAFVFNGTRLRILDAGRLFARRYAEFDLDAVVDDSKTLLAFLTLVGAAASTGAGPGPSLDTLVAASDRHAAGVCRSLRGGVLAASADVLRALLGARPPADPAALNDAFEQALTIVYRMLFLLFAEARALVPVWHPVYRESYSLESLRAAAESVRGEAGLWDALRAIARLAHEGCRAGDLRVAPFNGRLFAPGRTPLAERRDLDDGAARQAVLALATRPAPGGIGREPVAYRDLGVEQLGAVYETLLDYAPRIERVPAAVRSRARFNVTLAPGSGVRKATGTFYTPQPIAEYLVRRTLAPLVADLAPEQILRLRIVDPAMGSGAFLVAACRFLAGAYEAALVQTGGCHGADIGEPERALMRRAIAERCLYGVDVNPMAVQLARLSLWLATLAADRPLSFLDHRLLAGDSLVGAWLANIRQPPGLPRRRRQDSTTLPLFEESAVRDALLEALPARFSLESTPNDTVEQVRTKERALDAMAARDGALTAWKRVADLWCATWFSISSRQVPAAAFDDLSDAILSGRRALPAAATARYLEAADLIARDRRFFHWELEFPEVFFDADGTRCHLGGFDAVIGNPPWDMLRADQGSSSDRRRARDDTRPVLRFTRDAGVYHAQSDGHGNRYQLFLKRALTLARHGGRLGLVLPSGLAIDRGSAELRRQLLTRSDVDTIVGFDNRRGLFPIHRGVGFLLLTASAGSPTRTITARFGLEEPGELEQLGNSASRQSIQLSPALLRQLSGDDMTIPLFRTPTDLAIAERASAIFAPLGSERGWSVRFGRELNATEDRPSFRKAGEGLPVVEGKQLEPFRIALARSRNGIERREARRLLTGGGFERPRLAYRDVASATNRLTLIAAVLPGGCVSTHTLFCLRTKLAGADQHLLCGLFNSFVVNFLVRTRVTTHVTTATVEGLPMPRRAQAPGACREIGALARLLSTRPSPSAHARLQARVAELYQLSPAEFEHVLSTFPLVPEEERRAAFAAFLGRDTEARRGHRDG